MSPSSGSSPQKLTFLHLPGELRNEIYSNYICSYAKPLGSFSASNTGEKWFLPYIHSYWDASRLFCTDNDIGRLFNGCVSLFLANRQVHAEARSLFHGLLLPEIGFATRKVEVLTNLLRVVPPEAQPRLTGMLCFIMLAFTNEGNVAGVALSVLEMLAVDFGYIDAQEMKLENRHALDANGHHRSLYHVLSKRWSSGVTCWMDFDVEEDEGWFHEIYISGSLGKLDCLRELERKLRREAMFGWISPRRVSVVE